jgi:cytochrome c oxidase subunit 2
MHLTPKAMSSGALLLVTLVAAALLTGCQTSLSVMAPASPTAARIADLSWTLFWIAVVVFVGVEATLLWAIFRFRAKAGDGEEPPQVYGHARLEIAWTAVPAIVLVGVLVMMVGTMNAVAQPPTDALTVNVIGHQWWWEVRYPGDANGTTAGIVTANEIHVPVGRPVKVVLTSADVVHSFWVPELGGKMDLIPGKVNQMWFQADKTGVFKGRCAEFCGVEHAGMGFLVVADPPEKYQAWVNNQQAAAAAPTEELAKEGGELFQNSACIGCHTISGTRAQGVLGPNLAHVGSRLALAADTISNTPEEMARWLTNPQAVKPGNKMPNLSLSSEAVQQLTAYLQSLK